MSDRFAPLDLPMPFLPDPPLPPMTPPRQWRVTFTDPSTEVQVVEASAYEIHDRMHVFLDETGQAVVTIAADEVRSVRPVKGTEAR